MNRQGLPLTSRAALLMEKTTGEILFAQNEHEALEPASVTKIMTLLLTMDAIDSGAMAYDDVVTVSANAAGMGGSQVFLAEGEKITVEELLKSVCVSSGNDAAVALAEKVSGVTELFVEQMNNRAKGLGMDDTHFVNCTGLTAKGHVTSAYDIALMSRELLTKHPDIRRFTTIWTDTIRDGTFVRALALPFSTRAVTPSSGSISDTCSVSPMDTGRTGSDSSGAADTSA